MAITKERYKTALYKRLSREDGDKPESDSITHQQYVLEDFCARHREFSVVDEYADDGYTGTNFDRPDFRRMIADIEAGRIDCVIVKDLSRFGRDYIDMGYYLERWFPEKGVRFIAVNDNVDSARGAYDMMLPLKNVFNTQYAKDISEKVRTSIRAKQSRGEFVGAFASYGYLKDPKNRNQLIVDPVAAKVVQRIFTMTAQGIGQVKIAKTLNEEKIPCPGDYKRMMGEKYENSKRLHSTCYWTYSTIHKILRNRMYIGDMVQNRSVRATMHGKARKADEKDWIIVEGTHEPIISRELWDTVQAMIAGHAREIDFNGNVGLFAGFLRCGDCGRAMTKTTWGDRVTYSCGSYHRYGFNACSSHYTKEKDLVEIILNDLNHIIAAVKDLKQIAESSGTKNLQHGDGERKRLEAALARIRRLKQSSYEDYREGILHKEEFLSYREDYERQEKTLAEQLDALAKQDEPHKILQQPWVENLIRLGKLTELDRATLAQTVKVIRVFENKRIEITYLFSDALRTLLENNNDENERI